MSFKEYLRNSSNNFEKLNSQLEKLESKTSYKDPIEEKLWKLDTDVSGNGAAVIRFLPAKDGEDVPFVRVWDHGFQGPGGWYIEKSLTTIEQNDPVSELNSALWNTGIESDKEIARKQKRRLSYYSNILVIKDPKHPENEGKVFLYKYGKKIFDKIKDMMYPQFEDEKKVNVFDLLNGSNFRLKARKVDGWVNYDKSEFDSPGPLSEDEAELERVYDSLHSLQEIIDPKNFKTYQELEAKLNRVLGRNSSVTKRNETDDNSWHKEEPAPRIKEESASSLPSLNADDDDDDLDLDYFKNLAEED